MHITQQDLKSYTRFYRGNLVNCLTGCKPAMLIGTANADGKTNLALFSNIFHLGADPALIGFVQRPVGQSGDTFRNIEATEVFTLNFVHQAILSKAHYASARFEAGISEFDECALSPEFIDGFSAPFVHECHIKIGLRHVQTMPVELNNTQLVIGAIEHIMLDEKIIEADGNLKLDATNALSVVGLENYYTPQFLQHMPYAKAEQKPNF
jgi:flavin reductase (DIM6/NTAB) family NADH-FMN oxidoreductase RutF